MWWKINKNKIQTNMFYKKSEAEFGEFERY